METGYEAPNRCGFISRLPMPPSLLKHIHDKMSILSADFLISSASICPRRPNYLTDSNAFHTPAASFRHRFHKRAYDIRIDRECGINAKNIARQQCRSRIPLFRTPRCRHTVSARIFQVSSPHHPNCFRESAHTSDICPSAEKTCRFRLQ